MMKRVFLSVGCCLVFAWLGMSGFTQTFQPVWSASALSEIQSFTLSEKHAGTHYFYWYDYPESHFFDNGEHTDDALQDHFPDAEPVSYNSIEWHSKQLEDCEAAGIDFILPVYWGSVDAYFHQGIIFSIRGLGPLQTAIDRREREGKKSPKIGMFYDTSSLLPAVRGENRGERYDLRTEEGKKIFYGTIRDFFYQIHPRHWAAIDGRPIVVLYGSSFANYHDQSTVNYVYQQFAQDFNGIKPFIIRDVSWHFESDATTSWGAALSGPNHFGAVSQIGAGYNDSAVPGRRTPIRDREDGNFYRDSWNQVLQNDIHLVILETWNEMHEGTDICESREYGRKYINLTREYVDQWKRNEKNSETIKLKNPNPLPPAPLQEGIEFKDAVSVRISFENQEQSQGIWLIRSNEDGAVQNSERGNVTCIQTRSAEIAYLYFSVADPFFYNQHQSMELEYTYWDDGNQQHFLQYDSWETEGALKGAYKSASPVPCGHTGQWVTRRVILEDARFVDRENAGSDFRFCVNDGWLAIKDVTLKKLSSAP